MRLIDADALIDRLDYCVKEGMGSTIAFTFKHMVEEAPTIDIPHGDDWEKYSERLWKNAYERGKADRPQGEWIDKGRNLWGCSNCGMEIYSESEQDRNEFHKWCSRCGCQMKGADDDRV